MMAVWRLLPLLVLWAMMTSHVSCQGFVTVSFFENAIEIEEGQTFNVRLSKQGINEEPFLLIVEVENDQNGDFVGRTQVARFGASQSTLSSVSFTIKEDAEPEDDEIFYLRIISLNENVKNGRLTRMKVTVLANDDAYGIFKINNASPVMTQELLYTHNLNLRVVREAARFGTVDVHYLLNSTSEDGETGLDLSPAHGTLRFQPNQAEGVIQLEIAADNLPENDESFYIQLTSALVVSDDPKQAIVIDTPVQIIIKENDAPVRFVQSQFRFEEGPQTRRVKVEVVRGLSQDGSKTFGPINGRVTVQYEFISNSAQENVDFSFGNERTLTFEPEVTSQFIEFVIEDDDSPELEESFRIRIQNIQGDAVLFDPSIASVIINANDNPNGILSFEAGSDGGLPLKLVNEDTFTVIKFVVKRYEGTHGEVTVDWRIRRDRKSQPVIDDVGPSEGTLTFLNGENEAEIVLTVVQDTSPEEAEMFIINLDSTSVTGDAKVEGISEAKFLLEDSDNVYGTVEFGPDFDHSIVSDQTPRLLRLSLTRSGGKSENLNVNISVTYDDGTHDINENDVFAEPEKTFVMESQKNPVVAEFELLPSTFLVVNGEFKATILGVEIQTELSYGAFNSPKIGTKKSVSVRVSQLEANGETGFFNISTIEIKEPEAGIEEVILLVSREGLSGDATIRWSISGDSITSDDVVAMNGILQLNSGVGETTLIIGIKADDIPEVDESIKVTLDTIEPLTTQRLRADSTEIIILVKANDNPGGIMRFSPLMNSTYTVQEGTTPIEVIVERVGGDLVDRSVQYTIEPGGSSEFFGATNVLSFRAGQNESRATILPISDKIPELREKFVLVLVPNGDPPSEVGEPKSITITIEENEQPYGIIHFPEEPTIISTGEGSRDAETKVTLKVKRDSGTFGIVLVPWSLSPNVEEDLTPSSGTIVFQDGQNEQEISLTVVNDEIPEPDETYAVQLSTPQGGAVAGSPMIATVVILENDNPVEFVEPSVFTNEPSIVQLLIRRQGRAEKEASIHYRTLDDRASSADGDYELIKTKLLVFESGESEKSISVNILDDALPEGNETFTVQLFDVGGDLITNDNSSAIIHILANDAAYGIFSFATQSDDEIEEGSTTFIQIDRKEGNFGSVGVSWEIHTLNNIRATPGEDFKVTQGQVIFSPQESKQFLPFSPLADGNPEKEEKFLLKLTGIEVISGMASSGLASLDSSNLVKTVIVKASNDPFGQMAFSQDARELSVAEDFYSGEEASTKATFIVDRRQGDQEKIQVLWEVFTDELGGNIPKTFDFLFSGERNPSLEDVTSKRRPGTMTPVFLFSGAEGQFVRVPIDAQPSASEVISSFSLSAWVQIISDADGFIVAHCDAAGSSCHYGLQILCTSSLTKITLEMPSNSVFVVDSLAPIQDGRWHHIFVSISNKTVTFYLDGNLVSTSNKPQYAHPSGLTSLFVGAKPPGTKIFNGYLQDVRLFTRSMEERTVKEIFLNAALKDVTPISGILTYEAGNREQSFTLSSQQDIEEEGKEVFDIILLAATGGATLSSTDAHTTLAVLKSDNANGLFGFKEACSPSRIQAEGLDVQCVVQRLRGDDGSVSVSWTIQQRDGNILKVASTDFNQTQGILKFSPGQRENIFSFKAAEDKIAELDEIFEVHLTDSVSDDGLKGSTNRSGASIDDSKSVSQITIQENDFPYGLLQFSDQLLITPSQGQVILPVDSIVKVNVTEEGGIAPLVVLRAQGTLGDIQVEWRTQDLTAFSQGKTPPDYVGAVGSISMASGENYAFVNITVKDNSFPETEKIFEVELLNPTDGVKLGPGAKVQVTIAASDDAYGRFQFADSMLETVHSEYGLGGYNTVGLQVIRLGGRIGAVNLNWQAEEEESDGSDLLEYSGTVLFESGENIKILELRIRDDTLAEPDERVTIKLTGLDKGVLGDSKKTTAIVTISANDDPYGYFVIAKDARLVRVEEKDQEYKIRIERKGGVFGAVDVTFKTLKPDEGTDILPGQIVRADESDFEEHEGRISFVQNQKFAEFSIHILDDNNPEVDESIFVRLTGVTLVQGVPEIGDSSTPKLGSESETFSRIVIENNDDANGRLSLSTAKLSVEESVGKIPLEIVRSGGSIGQVSVSFSTIDGSAKINVDYVVQSRVVIFAPGETSKQIEIAIVEDIIPELDETFAIELDPTSVSEGAALGDVLKADITILPSDDPNGVFSFALSKIDTEERDQTHNVIIDVLRNGGSVGPVEVKWEAKLQGALATDDITPASGSLFFVTNDQRRQITIMILPDDLPEGFENIQIQLISVSDGGRIGENKLCILSIAPNDSPHGVIEFSSRNFAVLEDPSSVQNVQIVRSGGTYGQLEVLFSTSSMTLVELASHQSVAVTDLFKPSVKGRPTDNGNTINITQDDTLAACTSACLMESTCAAFVYMTGLDGVVCMWYTSVLPTDELEENNNADYYKKDHEKIKSLRMNQANPGEDFSITSNGVTILEDGQTIGQISTPIASDNIPELNETFWVELKSVRVVNEEQKTSDEPILGSIKKASVTILVNDNAFGVFSIQSSQGGQDSTRIEVEEADKRAVDFVVRREGGSIGSVSVKWSVSGQGRTATYNEDFIADGATLTFGIGQTQRVISVTLLEDLIPEVDEEFTVFLHSPTDGATISNNNYTTVVILANDFVAGILSFENAAVLLSEGDKSQMKIKRSLPALGTVTATWKLHGRNGLNPTTTFKTTSGSLTFLRAEIEKTIEIEVLSDEHPEVKEEYSLTLENITTQGIGPTGAAILNSQRGSSLITIASSDDPHGIIQFARASLQLSVQENVGQATLVVDRKFGNIGVIRLSYEVVQGSLKPNPSRRNAASAGSDYRQESSGFIQMETGQTTGNINIEILEDDEPEIDEAFVVRLTSVTLLDSTNPELPPKLAENETEAEIIIRANDGAQGVISFSPDSVSFSASEQGQNISLTVIRADGTFGRVSVFYYSQAISESVLKGTDYELEDGNLVFEEGESRKTIIVTIKNDEVPEPAEMFDIILTNPRDGAVLGEANRASVTILANDIAGGYVAFDSDDDISLSEAVGSDTSKSQVVRVTRGPGVFGDVTITFSIKSSTGQLSQDVSPNSGIITFSDRESEAVLVLTAVDDEEPEIEEMFTLLLENPTGKSQLGSLVSRTVKVTPSDSPYGLLQIFTSTTRLSNYTVEEREQVLMFDIVRSKGTIGKIGVDFMTRADTAKANVDKNHVVLAQLDKSAAISTVSWHQVNVGTETFIMVLTSLPSDTQLASLSNKLDSSNNGQSVLYKWQGQLTLMKTFQTNGATSATSLDIDGSKYVFITNGGREGARDVNSILYSISQEGEMEELQSLSTSGATDAEYFTYNSNSFMIVTNSLDSSSNSDIDSYLFSWDTSSGRFISTPKAVIKTLFAKAVTSFILDDELYIVIANYYDRNSNSYEINSVLYRLDNNFNLVQHQQLTTQGAVSVAYNEVKGMHQLIIANNRQNVIKTPQDSVVYRWNSLTRSFILHQTIPTNRVESVKAYNTDPDTSLLIFANRLSNSQIYIWNTQTNKYQEAWSGEPALSLQPITIQQSSGNLNLLGSASVDRQTEPTLFQISHVASNSDFVPRKVRMTFEPGQTILQCSAVVLTDEIPEDNERFIVVLDSPTGGAEIGLANSVDVEIQTNDNAHGVIEFSEDDLNLDVEEKENEDTTVLLSVVRKEGFFGRVIVAWQAAGDQSGVGDISPLSGQVEFADKQSQATITLFVRDDQEPEFAEVTYVRLTNIVESGTQVDSQGAKLGQNNVAKITVLANDSPYGVIAWEKSSVTMQEPKDSDSTIELNIIRRQGLEQAIRITYVTSTTDEVPVERRATPGEDFVTTQSSVTMAEGESRAKISITIKKDEIPETDETFQVNLTSVSLVNNENQDGGAQPSIRVGRSAVLVTIAENDDARGIIEFDVATNIEGRVDVYEEYGKNVTLDLSVKRLVGFFGSLTVTWRANINEAGLFDFFPSSGTVVFADQQKENKISITIIDDTDPEEMETFDVKLVSVQGGSKLGTSTSVKVAILKNDSPSGLFKFATSQVETQEGQSVTDANGQAVVLVQRVQATQGPVRVTWRLSAGSEKDFVPPLEGEVQFEDGENEKRIILQTLPDNVLEGREEFTISLVDKTNGADISPTEGDCTVVILPNPGSSGVVAIVQDSRQIIVGEPGETSPQYTGRKEIKLTRGLGKYGKVEVSWTITPRDINAFMQVEGNVVFDDLQDSTSITIQTRDDSTPELEVTYSLQLNSATGGATLSTEAKTASIVYAASDFPHGLVQFSLPEAMSISEEGPSSFQLQVERTKGLVGQLQVAYTTIPGEAKENEDYLPSSGFLRFLSGETNKAIEVGLRNDDKPEGPETFYVNLTSVELVNDQNDYSVLDGLTRDMRPELGTLSRKIITINKSDDPEGTIQFVDSSVTVKEEAGRVEIAVERIDGNYGAVGVKYNTVEGTAMKDVDYISSSGDLLLADQQENASIIIQIQDDFVMEPAETFKVILTSTIGAAKLGSRTTATVTIQKSEYPNGRFAFTEPLSLTLPNPEKNVTRDLFIQRSGGVLGKQQDASLLHITFPSTVDASTNLAPGRGVRKKIIISVFPKDTLQDQAPVFWRIMGPNNPELQLDDTSDISHNANGKDVTSGSLTWEDGEAGAKKLPLIIKPYLSWEIEKTFIVELHRIDHFGTEEGKGEIDQMDGKVQIKILRFGDPNGVVGFAEEHNEISTIREPEENSPTTLKFIIERKEGITGNIIVYWEVHGESLTASDIQPQEGNVLMAENQREAEISLQILPDDEPELTELMAVILTRVEGGAEIDKRFNQSQFNIRFNDHPHGEFAFLPKYQAIDVDPSDLARSIKLNFTRFHGTFGSILLSYSISFDGGSLITLNPDGGTLVFNEGIQNLSVSVGIIGNHFLAVGSTFTAYITNLTFIGSGETEPPKIRTGFSKTQIPVPPIAGNSELSFSNNLAMVNEEEQTLTVTIKRIGTYGPLSVEWLSGYAPENLTNGLVNGQITPSMDTVRMTHSQDTVDVTVQVLPRTNQKEVFALRLPRSPQSVVNGGARLGSTNLLVHVEQYGLIRFADDSLAPVVSELDGEISLTLWRLYGSVGQVLVHYNTEEGTAVQALDFEPYQNGLETMGNGELTTKLKIKVYQDNIPEPSEKFSVNLTKVERFPTPLDPVQSPRVSHLYSMSQVTIRESNDPYGIFSLKPVERTVTEARASITITVTRSGGSFGSVSVTVRTVGGGEPWTSQINPSNDHQRDDTIADVLGKRDSINAAEYGKDYEVLDTVVNFGPRETEKPVTITILEDSLAEPFETVLLYLTQPTGGARVAAGSADGGLKGYSIVTISASDTSNGLIGFKESSKEVQIDEDESPTFTLGLLRLNAFFGQVKVKWRAKKTLSSTSEEDADLTSQLVTVSGEATCIASQSDCDLQVQIIDDKIPEKSYTFYIILTSAGEDSQINDQSSSSFVTISPSDDVEGLIQLSDASRLIVVGERDKQVEIQVKKLNGEDNDITVAYSTRMLTDEIEVFGVKVQPALKSQDFTSQTSILRFASELEFIVITLTPDAASSNSLPKQFEVYIHSPTGGARIDSNASVATIQIVKQVELPMWQAISQQPENPYSQDNDVVSLVSSLDVMAQGTLTDENIKIIKNVLRNVNEEGLVRRYPTSVTISVHNLYCKLLSNIADARAGQHSLTMLLENFAFTLLTDTPCNDKEELEESSQCGNVKISAGRWLPDHLSNHQFKTHLDNSFTLPQDLPSRDTLVDGTDDECMDFGLLQYGSSTWFQTRNSGGNPAGQKIISFNFKGETSAPISAPVLFKITMPNQRVAPKDSKCVYFDVGEEKWQPSVCNPTNDLSKGIDTYVDCQCGHMSSYAILVSATNDDDDDDGIADYVVWFYIIAFICMYCLLTTVLVHHMCFPLATFSASLNMHFFMAVFFTQLCFVIDAFLSPDEILRKESETSDNSKCIVMSLFLHYFFLTQFSWIGIQSVNLWKILVLNDEHSGRHFCAFFSIGWGVPAILLAIFYAATYNIFKYETDLSEDFIYGNVNDLDHICFITNEYAALAGILLPVLISLFIVGIVFVKAYQIASQWQSYDDVYRGFYNSREIPILLLIWALLIITYLWLGLHMIYGYEWLLIMFCIFDLIMCLLIFILYAIVRNPKLSHICGTPKSTYVISDEVAGLPLPEPFYDTHSSMASLKGSQSNLVNDAWEKGTNGGFSQMTVRRALPSQVYINPPIAVVSPANTIDSNIPDFDDLIYALKVGRSLTPSELSRSLDDDISQLSIPLDHYETKRINIADTHL